MSGVQIEFESKNIKAQRDLEAINNSLRNIQKTTDSASTSLKNMALSLGSLATVGLAANYIKNVSTEFTNLSNKIATVTGKTNELLRTQEALFKLSEDTRSSLQGTVSTFASFGRALKSANISTDKILQATKVVQEAVAISGASAESASAALVQLGQGISSGVLRGEELNSVLEQTPRIAQAIADELGVTLGSLRLIAADGRLTSEVVFESLLRQSSKISDEFKSLTPTIAQANSLLSDSIKIYVNELDKGLGFSEAIGTSTFSLAKRIKEASKNAFELGTNISIAINRIQANFGIIAKPILKIFSELGKQIAQVFPTFIFTRTLKRDFSELVMIVDVFSGGLFTRLKRLGSLDGILSAIIPFYKIRSDVELALDEIAKLSPTRWAGFGFNRTTFSRIFNLDFVLQYGVAFKNLAAEVTANTTSIGGALTQFFKDFAGFGRRFLTYFGVIPDTLILIVKGNLENFLTTLAEIVRGASQVSIKFYQLGRILEYYLLPSIETLKTALQDATPVALRALSTALLRGVFEVSKFIINIISQFANLPLIDTSFDDFVEMVLDKFSEIKDNLEDLLDYSRELWSEFIETLENLPLVNLSFDELVELISESLNKIKDDLEDLLDDGKELWADFIKIVKTLTANLWSSIRANLELFKENTIDIFKDIYEEVIGNSWWTDTVESVINASNNLWDKVSNGLNKFKQNTINIFKNIFDSSRRLDFSNAKFTSIDLTNIKLKLPTVDSKSFSDSFEKIYERTVDILKKLSETYPEVFKLIMTSIAGVLITALFPAGLLKTALIGSILTSIATTSTILAEAFGAALTGGSFVSEVGYRLGQLAGFVVKTLISELPLFLNALLGVVSAFVRGFTEQLPIIGSLISGIFSTANVLGLAGPLGIIGLFLVGTKGLSVFKYFDVFKDSISTLENFISKSKTIILGQGEGIISKYLFGKFGATRVFSFIGLLLGTLGGFDSLFSGSAIAQYAAGGGLIYTFLFGDRGVDKIKDYFLKSVIAPLANILRVQVASLAGGLTLGTAAATQGTNLFNVFFGKEGTWVERGSVFIKQVLDKISSKVVDTATPYVEKGYDFVKTILLGKDPEKTLASIKRITKTNIGAFLVEFDLLKEKLAGSLSKATASANPVGLLSGLASSISGIVSTISGQFSNLFSSVKKQYDKNVGSASDLASKIGGDQGLLGKLFFGKAGRIVLIGGILAAFATFASAATQAQNYPRNDLERDATTFASIVDNFRKFADESPLAAAFTSFILVAIPAALAAAVLFRNQLVLLFAYASKAISANLALAFANVGTRNAAILSGISGLAGLISYNITGSVMSGLEAALSVAAILSVFRKSLFPAIASAFNFVFLRIIPAIFGVIFSIKTAIITAIIALIDWFFGLELIAFAKKLLNLTKEPVKTNTGLSQEQENFARSRELGIDYSLRNINRDRLSEADTKKLDESIKRLDDTINRARDQEEQLGVIQDDTRDEIRANTRALNNLVPKLEARSRVPTQDFAQSIQDLVNFEPKTPAQIFTNSIRQLGLNFSFNINKLVIELRRRYGTPEQKKLASEDLAALEKERTTRFNARFRVVSEDDKNIAALAKKVKDLKFPDEKLKQQIDITEQSYFNALEIVSKAEKNLVGLFTQPLPRSDERVRQLELFREQLANEYQKQIRFDESKRQINEFTSRLSSIRDNFKSIKADVDFDELIAVDEASFKDLERLGKDAKELAEQLANTKNIAERNEIIVRITEIKTQILNFKIGADALSLDRKQFKLPELFGKIGIEMSKQLAESFSDDVADRLYAAGTKILQRQTELLTKVPGAFESKIPGQDGISIIQRIRSFFKDRTIPDEVQQAIDSYEDTKKEIEDSLEKLKRSVATSASATTESNLIYFRDLSNSFGIDFNDLIIKQGVSAAIGSLKALEGLQKQINKAQREDPAALANLYLRYQTFLEQLKAPARGINEIINNISSLGQSFKLEDVFKFDRSDFEEFKNIDRALDTLQTNIKLKGPAVTLEDIVQFGKKEQELQKRSFELYLKNLYKSGTRILEGLGKIGFSDITEISYLSTDLINKLKASNLEILKLEKELEKVDTTDAFLDLIDRLDAAKRKAKELRDSVASFDTQFNVINRVFGTNLTEQEAARVSTRRLRDLYDESLKIETKLKELREAPTYPGLVDPLLQLEAVRGTLSEEETVTVTGRRNVDFNAQISEQLQALQRRRLEINKEMLDARYSERRFAVQFEPNTELIKGMTEVFPAVSEFKDTLGLFSRSQLEYYGAIVEAVKDLQRRSDVGAIDPQFAADNIADLIRLGTERAQKDLENLKFGEGFYSKLKQLGVDVDRESINLISKIDRNLIQNLIKDYEDAIKDRNAILKDPNASDVDLAQAQESVNKQRRLITRALENSIQDITKIAEEAGIEFSKAITDDFKSSLIQRLRKDITSAEFDKRLAATVSDKVLNAFISGLTDPILGKEGFITKSLQTVGSNIYTYGLKSFNYLVTQLFTKDTFIYLISIIRLGFTSLKDGLLFAYGILRKGLDSIINSLNNFLTQNDFGKIINNLVGFLSQIFKAIFDLPSKILKGDLLKDLSLDSNIIDKIKAPIAAIFSGIGDTVLTAIGGLINIVNNAVDKLNDFLTKNDFGKIINNFVGLIFDIGKTILNKINIFKPVPLDDLASVGSNIMASAADNSNGIVDAVDFASGSEESTGILGSILNLLAPLTGIFTSFFGLFASNEISTQVFQQLILGYMNAIVTLLGNIFARVSIDNPAFATGGKVSGPGTGTSDSILARLSDGEFVINAAATKQNLPLLEMINSGKVPKFNSGGLVTGNLMQTPSSMKFDTAKSNKNQQVINVNITGDVSRQTKSEIYKMLPVIADGVNMQNRERNYRG